MFVETGRNILWTTVSVSGMLKRRRNSSVLEAIASAFLASDMRRMYSKAAKMPQSLFGL